MAMGAKGETGTLPGTGEVYACPTCGYRDGFHVSFLFEEGSGEEEVHLICPDCHARFRIGWKIRTSNEQ